MKICDGYEILINQYIDGELEPQQEAELRAHLDSCPACNEYYRQLCEISDGMAKLEFPPNLHESIMEAVNKEREKGYKKVIFFKRPSFAASVAAVLAIGLVGIAGYKNGMLGPPTTDENTAEAQNDMALMAELDVDQPDSVTFYADSNKEDRHISRSYKLETHMKSWFEGDGGDKYAVYNNRGIAEQPENGEPLAGGSRENGVRLSRIVDTIGEDTGEKYGFCMIACGDIEELPDEFADFAGDSLPGSVLVVSVKNDISVKTEIDRSMSENGFEVFYDEEGEYFTVDETAETALVIIEFDGE